jgi:hypothetical protein
VGTVHTIHIDKTTTMNQNTNQGTVHTIKIYIDKTTAMKHTRPIGRNNTIKITIHIGKTKEV